MTQSTTHAISSPCRRLVRRTVVLEAEAANSSVLSSNRSSDAAEGGLAAPAGSRVSFTMACPLQVGRQQWRALGGLPLPLGEGWGEGLWSLDESEPPSPQPSPRWGEGAHRACGWH